MPQDKEIPEIYLRRAKELFRQDSITQREFIDLCLLAMRLIDDGDTTAAGRNAMAYYITNLWFRHDNISSKNLLDEIGGQFSEWEVPGYFTLDDELDIRTWQRLKGWIMEADASFPKG